MVSRHQLVECGLGPWRIARLVADGHVVTDGVQGLYRSTTVAPTLMTRSWSAVLAARAVLSHQSAAALWGIEVPQSELLHVTVPGRRRTRPPGGVRIHRVALRAEDVTELDGLRVTTRQRTVLDCLGALPDHQARPLFDRALQRKWISVDDVLHRLIVERGRWGNRRLRRLAAGALVGDSDLERLFHSLLKAAGITGWQPNAPVQLSRGVVTVDVLFRSQRLVVELDGWAFHSDPERFQADRRRQNALVAEGWTVVRFTWRDLVERPEAVTAQVRASLAAAA